MQRQRFLQFLLIFGTILCMAVPFFYQKTMPTEGKDLYPSELLTQNNYMGPIKKIPGNPQLVRIEVLIQDSPALGGVQIESVSFDQQNIPLKPRDIYGNRGGASFQKMPGKYTLTWTVLRDKTVWPREITHEEIVTVDPRDLWIQISVVGEEVSIL